MNYITLRNGRKLYGAKMQVDEFGNKRVNDDEWCRAMDRLFGGKPDEGEGYVDEDAGSDRDPDTWR